MEDTIVQEQPPVQETKLQEVQAPETPKEPTLEPETQAPPALQQEETAPPRRKKLYFEHVLAIIALCCAALLAVMVLVCLPYFGEPDEDPQSQVHREVQDTQAPEEELPPDPTSPQPEANPYGKLDFQYEGRYLGCLKADTVPGVDVSKYQGEVDWDQVADAGIQFAMVRVGYRGYGQEGKLVKDDTGPGNIQGALAAGLDVGVYFFSQAITVEEAVEEAEFVLEIIQDYALTMPVVYDWEFINDEARTANIDSRTLTDCYLAFCQRIAEAGYTPMPYFNTHLTRTHLNLWELEEYPFWLALYSDRMTFPYRVEMWQYTCTGRVPGIEGDVDINLYFTED